MTCRWLAVAALLATAAAGAAAEVTALQAQGFVVEHQIELAGSPERAYRAITEEVDVWWDGDHSWSGDAGNLSLDSRAGGCFCERLPEGGSVEHMRVLFAAPGRLLRLSGGLGPLQAMGASGVMDFALEAVAGGGSRLRFRYVVGGFVPGGLEAIAPAVDSVLAGQLARLQAHLAAG